MSPTTQLFNPNADSMLLRRILKLNIRGVLGVGSVTCLFFAVRYLPIADAIIFTFLTPVLITIAAPFVLREDAGNQWLPILCAMFGVILICQPSFLFGQARLSLVGVIFGSAHAISSSAAKVQFHDVLMSMSHAHGPFLLATSTQATWKPGGL